MNKNWHKSMSDRMIFGVCGGIGETLGVNSSIIRGVFVILAIISRSLMLWVYLLLSFLLPDGQAGGPGRGGFGGRGRPDEGPFAQSGQGRAGRYSPDDPPFDISGAQDVETHPADDRDER